MFHCTLRAQITCFHIVYPQYTVNTGLSSSYTYYGYCITSFKSNEIDDSIVRICIEILNENYAQLVNAYVPFEVIKFCWNNYISFEINYFYFNLFLFQQ